jgi:S1-C subfamily serine protease
MLLVMLALGLTGCVRQVRRAPPADLAFPYEDAKEPPAQAVRRLAEAVKGAYVQVTILGSSAADGRRREGVVDGASGTIVDPRGYLVTAAHIAKDRRNRARITTLDGRVLDAAILDVAAERELALLKLAPFPGMVAARLGAPGGLVGGGAVLALGTPGNRRGAVTLGRVRLPRREAPIRYGAYGYDGAMELAMEVEPGFSGGPLFDSCGRLLGMIASFGLGDPGRQPYVSTGLAYAVPARALQAYLAERLSPAPPTPAGSTPCDRK